MPELPYWLYCCSSVSWLQCDSIKKKNLWLLCTYWRGKRTTFFLEICRLFWSSISQRTKWSSIILVGSVDSMELAYDFGPAQYNVMATMYITYFYFSGVVSICENYFVITLYLIVSSFFFPPLLALTFARCIKHKMLHRRGGSSWLTIFSIWSVRYVYSHVLVMIMDVTHSSTLCVSGSCHAN